MAHDIRGPLYAVALSMDLLRRSEVLDEKLRPSVERGRSSLLRAERIVAGLLDFARAGARPEPGARCVVSEVLDDVISELRPVAEEEKIALSVAPVPPGEVACAPGILTSLLSNLLRNAIKYMDDMPVRRIVVRVERREAQILIEVEDTRPGLAPDVLESVFQPYVRAGRKLQPEIGLGLATVRRLAEAHGGRGALAAGTRQPLLV